MQKLLIRFVLFIVPIYLGAFLLDDAITKGIRKTQGGATGVWNEIINGKVNSDILILGSSRAINDFDPAILEDSLKKSAYNLGISGHNFTMVKCRYDVYVKYNRKPSVLLISADVFLLDKRKDLFEYKLIAPFLKEPIIKETTKQYEGFDFADYNLPLVRYTGYTFEINCAMKYYMGKLVAKHAKESAPGTPIENILLDKGYSPHFKEWDGELDNLLKKGEKFTAPVDTPTIIAFEKYLQQMVAEKIKVIIVNTPEYYKAGLFITNREQVLDIYKKMAAKYNIPYLDYTTDTMCQRTDYFFNAEHLNYKGATIFTSKLAHDLKSHL